MSNYNPKAIGSLLKKDYLTGEELGRLAVAQRAILYANRDAYSGSIFDNDLFMAKLARIAEDPDEMLDFRCYQLLRDWMEFRFNMAQTQFQQAQLQFRTISDMLNEITLKEAFLQHIADFPVSIPEAQFREDRAQAIESYVTDESGEDLTSNTYGILELWMFYWLNLLTDTPRKANPLKAIRKLYKTLPVESSRIRAEYNHLAHNGYYIDKKGKQHKCQGFVQWKTLTAGYQAIGQEPPTFVPADESPEDLTKWDVLENILLSDLYPFAEGSADPYEEDNFLESMREFTSEFPELVKAAEVNIHKEESWLDAFAPSETPLEAWETPITSWRELVEHNFCGSAEDAEALYRIYPDNNRAQISGVAIIPENHKEVYASNGRKRVFGEPELPSRFNSFGLEAFGTEDGAPGQRTAILENAQAMLESSYYYVRGYNLSVDFLAEHYRIPHLQEMKMNSQVLDRQIGVINDLIKNLEAMLSERARIMLGDEVIDWKLNRLHELFPRLEYTRKIPKKNIEAAKLILTDFGSFQGNSAGRALDILLAEMNADWGEEPNA